MPAYDGRELVIVSDLHLGRGLDPATGAYDPAEDFFYDGAFGRFVERLIASSPARDLRLVVLGDFVDFLQVELGPAAPGPVTSSRSAVAKLEAVAAGHPGTFEALGRFIGAGGRLALVAGNHDIEFIWEDVRAALRRLIGRHCAGTDLDVAISFHPWFYYAPGVVYAEHGHQYDPVNAFETQLTPYLPEQPDSIELPLGSFFVLYLFNAVERIDPFADNVRPMTRYMSWSLRTDPLRALNTLRRYLEFVGRTLPKARPPDPARLQRYRLERLPEYAAQVGLPPETLRALDELAATPALRSVPGLLRALAPLDPEALAALVGGLLYPATGRAGLGLQARAAASLAGAGATLYLSQRLREREIEGEREESFLYRAARSIHAELRRAGGGAHVYVFGHTHAPEQRRLSSATERPVYMNSGTWTPLIPQMFDLLGARERLTYVRVGRDRYDGAPYARLLVWNDSAEREEPFTTMLA
jgi:UDP-2,3-diacylglucosamine pyrophosphatase LpxH